MNRFLSKREKPGGLAAHKRDKSRDKSREKSRDKSSDRTAAKKKPFSVTLSAISAAFSNPNGKSSPVLQTTNLAVYTTSADSRHGFSLQTSSSNDSPLSIFRSKSDAQKKADKELSLRISKIQDKLHAHGFLRIEDEHINYALSLGHTNGDVDKAYETVLTYQESVEGYVKPYNSNVVMKGAENRENVTCYLDSLLFAMYARLSSFETILHKKFEDEPRRRLAFLIRLWVNMLRTGKLIEVDIAKNLQEALRDCGWHEAAELEQQDVSEAFSHITQFLELPLLTLKQDIYHQGIDDEQDDHKVTSERLLDVALPNDHDSSVPLKLEDCLENYFNNVVRVSRMFKIDRSDTRASIRSTQSHSSSKVASQHAENAEVSWSETPTGWGEGSMTPHSPTTPISPSGRERAPSFIRRFKIEDEVNEVSILPSDRAETPSSLRRGSLRKAFDIPAWQTFNLIPWNLQNPANNDSEVVQHFANGPVIGICIKRYSIENGVAKKNDTFVDIPLDLRLPHFVEEEGAVPEEGPASRNFKLSLQSVVCHQGNSLNSGHYLSYVRAGTKIADGDLHSDQALNNEEKPPHYPQDVWIRHNDLADPRVSYVDIEGVLAKESPYFLLYKVVPLFEDPQPLCSDLNQPSELPSESTSEPPSYADSGVGFKISGPTDGTVGGYFDGTTNESAPTIRFSSDLERPDHSRPSMNLGDQDRRGSTAMTETSLASTTSSAGISAPVTSNEETPVQRFSRAAARIAKSGSKSRPSSASGEGRLSSTFSRITWRASKEHLNRNETTKDVALGMDISRQVDGASESNRSSMVIDEHAEEGTYVQSETKRGRKRDKSKEPTDRSENHQHHSHKGKKDKSQINGVEEERVCSSM